MNEQPKRRGRPPGSKNRATDLPSPVLMNSIAPYGLQESPLIEQVAGSKSIKVILTAPRGAFGTPADEQVVEWPAGWRIPQPGDSVHLRKDWGGFVQAVDFDLETGSVRIFLR